MKKRFHGRIEVRARHGAERQTQHSQNSAVGSVLQKSASAPLPPASFAAMMPLPTAP